MPYRAIDHAAEALSDLDHLKAAIQDHDLDTVTSELYCLAEHLESILDRPGFRANISRALGYGRESRPNVVTPSSAFQ